MDIVPRARALVVVAAQTGLLWLIYAASQWMVATWHLPVPAAVLGIGWLYLLLAMGVVKERWFAAAAQVLLKHLAFFFIPVAVGIMAYRELLWQHGAAFAGIVLTTTVLGLAVAGRVGAAGATRERP